jgi:hypothetical protein
MASATRRALMFCEKGVLAVYTGGRMCFGSGVPGLGPGRAELQRKWELGCQPEPARSRERVWGRAAGLD